VYRGPAADGELLYRLAGLILLHVSFQLLHGGVGRVTRERDLAGDEDAVGGAAQRRDRFLAEYSGKCGYLAPEPRVLERLDGGGQ
jgi:hypothetical protein